MGLDVEFAPLAFETFALAVGVLRAPAAFARVALREWVATFSFEVESPPFRVLPLDPASFAADLPLESPSLGRVLGVVSELLEEEDELKLALFSLEPLLVEPEEDVCLSLLPADDEDGVVFEAPGEGDDGSTPFCLILPVAR